MARMSTYERDAYKVFRAASNLLGFIIGAAVIIGIALSMPI